MQKNRLHPPCMPGIEHFDELFRVILWQDGTRESRRLEQPLVTHRRRHALAPLHERRLAEVAHRGAHSGMAMHCI